MMTITDKVLRLPDGSIDHSAYRNTEGFVDVNGIRVRVRVTDTRQAYGRFDLCVTPIAGEGSRWIDYRNVVITTPIVPTHSHTALPL